MSDTPSVGRNRSHWPGAGEQAAGQTRLPHYPGEGPAPISPPATDATPAEEALPFDLDELFEDLQEKWKKAREHSNKWRDEAREAYDFVAGNQWNEDDLTLLRDQNRPAITFNRTGPMVNIVCGLEAGNRQEVRFLPREMGDVAVNEVLTEAVRWFRDQCDAEDEESDAFWDCVVGGVGWVGTELDYDCDPQGTVLIERIDPLEMYWDASARKKNLSDARVMFRVKETSLKEARDQYPDAKDEDLRATWAKNTLDTDPHDSDEAPFYRQRNHNSIAPDTERILLVEAQWWQHEKQWLMTDPITGQQAVIPDDKMETLRQRLQTVGVPEPHAVMQRVRCYWRAILGNKVLDVWKGPEKGGFTWKCLTGERDRNNGTWYGIVRAMMDPQRWANKWLSQSMHIMNTGAKGGILAETSAFPDIRQAQEDWAHPDAIVEVSDGAISASRIMPRPPNPMPPGLPELLTLALSSIRDCTGINLELLGLVEHDQPGIVEQQRKQAGMTVLAGLFNALRRYRKDQGQLLLWYVTSFLSDGRLIRVVGKDKAQYIPLLRQEGMAEYDVIVDDAPASPNMKERAWATLVQMMPLLRTMPVPPEIYLELLKYSPLPEGVTDKIAEILQNQPQKPDPLQIAAQGEAALNAARAKLAEAQAAKTMQDAKIGSHQAIAEHERTRMEAAKAVLDAQEISARIESLRSAALLNLSKAGVVQHDAQTDRMLAVLDMLDSLVSWHQGAQEAPVAANG